MVPVGGAVQLPKEHCFVLSVKTLEVGKLHRREGSACSRFFTGPGMRKSETSLNPKQECEHIEGYHVCILYVYID